MASFAGHRDSHKGPTVWVDGDRPPTTTTNRYNYEFNKLIMGEGNVASSHTLHKSVCQLELVPPKSNIFNKAGAFTSVTLTNVCRETG